ncbi:hypothetical protein NMY22_g9792 [Coprinellus aureogranulatus]|nr:hypothetical protein NMY22_g9792 [Coprinellus aureogranulatus]
MFPRSPQRSAHKPQYSRLAEFLSPASSSSVFGTTSSVPIHRTFRPPSSPTYELQPSIQVSPLPPPLDDFYRHRHRDTKVIQHPDLCGPSTPDCQSEAFPSTAF